MDLDSLARWEAPGRIAPYDGIILMSLAAALRDGSTVVECGTGHGVSTLYLDHALARCCRGYRFVSIGARTSEQRRRMILQNAEGPIELLRGLFDETVQRLFGENSIDLLFYDGGHLPAALLQHLQVILPRLNPQGVLLIHDVHHRFPEGREVETLVAKGSLRGIVLSLTCFKNHGLAILQKSHNRSRGT